LFDNGRAVCDGIAKAFSLMCGIENIKCYKAIGTAGDAQHAWNKVYISTPANSERAWYVVDATWSDQTVRDTTTNQRVEYFSHRYFLKTDAELINHHETTSNRQSATTQFDYYTYAKYGSDKSLKIIGNTKLSELQTYISINKPEYFEFRYERGSPTDVKEPTGISGYILVPLGQTEVGTCYYAYVKRKA